MDWRLVISRKYLLHYNMAASTILMIITITLCSLMAQHFGAQTWDDWVNNSPCSTTCGLGQINQTRKCKNDGKFCAGSSWQMIDCSGPICPYWAEWSNMSCSTTCGLGVMTQTRKCVSPIPTNGRQLCSGLTRQQNQCINITCPNWGSWQDSSPCSSSIGQGEMNQTRRCISPMPNVTCAGLGQRVISCGNSSTSKILVALGKSMGQETADVEIIDILSSSSTCEKPATFPFVNAQAVGILGFQMKPLICGGNINGTACQLYKDETWKSTYSLNQARSYFKMTRSPFQDNRSILFVTGGYVGTETYLSSSEILTENGWQVSVNLTITVAYHCMVTLNATTVIVIAGLQNGQTSGNSMLFNSETNKWSAGPTLITARGSQCCGSIIKHNQTQEMSIIAVGGWAPANFLNSTEVLDFGSNAWRNGPSLPVGISSSTLVTDPSGGVILIGGCSFSNVGLATLYSLSDAGQGSTWILMPQKLKTPRYDHTAFLVPDYITVCN